MGIIDSVRQIAALSADLATHAGDIAVLKMDLVGLKGSAAVRDQLGPEPPPVDLEALRALPDGTFGREYVRFLDAHGLSVLQLTAATSPEVRARNRYGIRYLTTHDMFHVLLGFGPDWPGELGVLAFTVGQRYSPVLWVQALAAWITYPLRSGFALGALWTAWKQGLAAGRSVPLLLPLPLEDRFPEDLESVRRSLGISS